MHDIVLCKPFVWVNKQACIDQDAKKLLTLNFSTHVMVLFGKSHNFFGFQYYP